MPTSSNSWEVTNCCLYCRSPGNANTVEHFLPERLGRGHPFHLKRGAVCNVCNGWASGDIDDALARIESDWLGLARIEGRNFGELPSRGTGRTWKPKVGILQIKAAGGEPKRLVKEQRFLSRALVKAALGAVYKTEGAEVALAPRLDAVREYAKKGTPHFAFVYYTAKGRWIDAEVGLAVDVGRDQNDSIYAVLQFYTQTFWVPLQRPVILPTNVTRIPGLKQVCDSGGSEFLGTATVLHVFPDRGVLTGQLHVFNGSTFVPTFLDEPGELLQSFNDRSPRWKGFGISGYAPEYPRQWPSFGGSQQSGRKVSEVRRRDRPNPTSTTFD